MSAENVATLTTFVQTFLGGDVDAALEHVHPDVVANEPGGLPYGGEYRGREAFAGLMRRIRETVAVEATGLRALRRR